MSPYPPLGFFIHITDWIMALRRSISHDSENPLTFICDLRHSFAAEVMTSDGLTTGLRRWEANYTGMRKTTAA